MGLRTLLCCAQSRKGQSGGQDGSDEQPPGQGAAEAQDDNLPQSGAEVMALSRKPTMGLRKPGETAASQDRHPDGDFDFREAEPKDYLYFGEGGKASASTNSHQTYAVHGKHNSTGGSSQQPTSISPSPGRDESGFINTGLNNQQMGYQNLTYGGSLQFDYTGTH